MADLDSLIYGHNPLPRVVAVEPDDSSGIVTVFQRNASGGTDESTYPFVPWLLAAENHPLSGAVITELSGTGYKFRYDLPKAGWRGFLDVRRQLRDFNIPIMSYGSQTKQFLLATGITLFLDMEFGDLRRMQIDIETSSLSPLDPHARVLLAAVSDSTGRADVLDGDETEVLEALGDKVRQWNPDVVEGHNIYGFDLPYILERARALGVQFTIGRHPNQIPTLGAPRNFAIGANSRPFTPVYIFGRHVIDTYLQVQRFDSAKGQISSYGLKECARVYNLSSVDRVIVDRSKMVEQLEKDPELIKLYARQDVEETGALAALVTPTDFYQTQMVPDSYQNVAITGNGEKVNALMVRGYLQQNHAIPFSSSSSEYPGGYTEVRRVGVIHRVVKTDVESLYPSIMLSRRIRPSTDTLDIFLPLLSDLTGRRLAAKAQAKQAKPDTSEFAYWDGLQGSYKILINSFYGYVGGPFYFNDFAAARAVTVAGQQIVKDIADKLEETGSIVIEIDTDGIYFQAPHRVNSQEMEERYIEEIAQVLPPGIRLAHDGRYAAMLSLKIKNYVLVEYDGRKIMKGSSLRSRADEPFGREFLSSAIDMLLAEDYELLSQLYSTLLAKIQDGLLPIKQIARRERVTNKLLDTPGRKRIAELLSEGTITLGDIVQIYNRNDGTLALESEYNFDEDRDYYAGKLYKFALRLIDAISEERFHQLCPKPKPAQQRLQERLQSSFEF
jgi:DNA polymerase elongation subunit (family B)